MEGERERKRETFNGVEEAGRVVSNLQRLADCDNTNDDGHHRVPNEGGREALSRPLIRFLSAKVGGMIICRHGNAGEQRLTSATELVPPGDTPVACEKLVR